MTDSVRMEPTSYDYVTKDVCKKWSSDGKSDILGQFVDLQKNQGKGEVGKNSPLLKARTIVHELIWRCLGQLWVQSNKLPSNGKQVSIVSPSHLRMIEPMGQYISTDDISQWLSQAAEQFPEVQSVFIDVILVVDAECSLEENDDHKARLAKVTALGSGLLSNKN